MENKEYKYIHLPNGDYIVIKFDIEGVVYDRFNKDDEHKESYGYDFYEELKLTKIK
tara:strand:- start:3 stop:170 length:168 start_codon:yes stop_codon:yes gene_type:complete